MAMIPPEEINPYLAPTASIRVPVEAGINSDAEVIRRTYLKYEASVKSLGTLNYLGAFGCILAMVFCGLAAIGAIDMSRNNANPDLNPQILMAFLAGAALLGLVIYGGLGYGLQHLQPWARWVTIVLMGFSLLSTSVQVLLAAVARPATFGATLIGGAFGALIPGYIFNLMISAKGKMVFSPEYREVIRITPHIKYKTSLIMKIFLGLLIFVLFAAIIGGIASTFATR